MRRFSDLPDALGTVLVSWRTWPWHAVLTVGLLAVIVGMLARPHGAAGLMMAITAVALLITSAVAVTVRDGFPALSRGPRLVADTESAVVAVIAPDPAPPVADAAWADFVINDIPRVDW